MAGRCRRWLRPPYPTALGNLWRMLVPAVMVIAGSYAFIDEDDRFAWAGERLLAVVVVMGGAITGSLHARYQRRPVKVRGAGASEGVEVAVWAVLVGVVLLLGRWTWTYMLGAFAGAHLAFLPLARMVFYPDERRWRRTAGQQAASAARPTARPWRRQRPPRARR